MQVTGTTALELVTEAVLSKQRYYIKSIAELIQFLAINEFPLRVDYGKETYCESGLFHNLLSYTLTKDKILAEIEKTIPQNAKYTSPMIQNLIIDELAAMVTESVVQDVNSSDAGCFTLLADGTRDKSKVKNISIAIRYVKNGEPCEHLLQMQLTEKLDALSLTNVILETLEKVGIDPAKIISQCYGGASCMSGDKAGVQRILQDLLQKLIHFHCFNHSLHLVVIAM